jgi:magnesium chelatase family protein
LDRIDLHVFVSALPASELLQTPAGESTSRIRERCQSARDMALKRQGKTNRELAGQEIDQYALPDSAALQFLNAAAARLGWSARGTHRTLRVARTIADLAGVKQCTLEHVAEAMQYRQFSRPAH